MIALSREVLNCILISMSIMMLIGFPQLINSEPSRIFAQIQSTDNASISDNLNYTIAKPRDATDIFIVQAGRENSSGIYDKFFPHMINIEKGQGISWVNPTNITHPHTVTFFLKNQSVTDTGATKNEHNSSNTMHTNKVLDGTITKVEQMLLKKFYNPIIENLSLNKASVIPWVVSLKNNIVYLSSENNEITYILDGAEAYLNSGIILPSYGISPGSLSVNKFTVVFEKSGTFSYHCLFHPKMTGQVVVGN